MHRRARIGLMICLLLQACSTVQPDLDKAKKKDTIGAYEHFLTLHPQSEHTTWVEQRIVKLKEEKEERIQKQIEEAKKENIIRWKKLKEYENQIGNLTEEQFLKDGWTTDGAHDGKTGIIGVLKNDLTSKFMLGYSPWGVLLSERDGLGGMWARTLSSFYGNYIMGALKEGNHIKSLPPREQLGKQIKLVAILTFSPVTLGDKVPEIQDCFPSCSQRLLREITFY